MSPLLSSLPEYVTRPRGRTGFGSLNVLAHDPIWDTAEEARTPAADAPAWPLEAFGPYLLLLARTRLHRRLRPKVDPSDLVQETLLRAWAHQGQCRGRTDGERASWLRAILANTVAEHLRRFRGPQRNLARECPLGTALPVLLSDPAAAPEQHAVDEEGTRRLAEALARLPDDQRRALEVHYLEGQPVSEVARQMGRSIASVASLLRRGLACLRQWLSDPAGGHHGRAEQDPPTRAATR